MSQPIHKYVPYGNSIELFKAKNSEVLLNGPALISRYRKE